MNPANSKLRGVIEGVDGQISTLEALLLRSLDDLSFEELGELVLAMDELKRRVADLASYTSTELLADMVPGEEYMVAGRSLEKKVGASSTKWDSTALKSVVAEAVIMDALNPETGSIEAPTGELVKRALECAGIGYWRVGELKKLSINPDHYRETKGATARLVIKKDNQ